MSTIITLSDLATITDQVIKAWHDIPANSRLSGSSRTLSAEEQRALAYLQAVLVVLNQKEMLKPEYSSSSLIEFDDFSELND